MNSHRPRPLRRTRGFSLLEILVVLIVIVILTSMVTLTVSTGGDDVLIESRVRTLADVAQYTLDEAQMTGENYGLRIVESFEGGDLVASYHWYRRELDGWGELGDEVFKPVTLPPGIELDLELPDAPVAETSLEDDESERILPQLVFYASGEMTEGALNVRRRETGELLWRIEWDLLGRFEVLRRGEPAPEAPL
jgi:prepilin-type N-terminal cleavage/methylation domain-containing protein